MCPIDKLKNLQLNFIKHELHPSPPCQDVIELTFTYIRSPPNTNYHFLLDLQYRVSLSLLSQIESIRSIFSEWSLRRMEIHIFQVLRILTKIHSVFQGIWSSTFISWICHSPSDQVRKTQFSSARNRSVVSQTFAS